jgi:hypothetical protein
MNMFRRQDKPRPLTRTEALACIPERSPGVAWNLLADGTLLLEYPLPIRPFFLNLARRFNLGRQEHLTRKLQLDQVGSAVWLLIDGQRDVRTLIVDFAAQSRLTRQEAEISLTIFLRDLGRRGLVMMR